MGEGPLDFPEDESAGEREARLEDQRRRWAHRQDPDLAALEPAPERRRGSSRYGWFLILAAVVFIGYVTLNTARSHRNSSTGLTPGAPLPGFAMPFADGGADADADVAVRPNEPRGAGRIPACELRGAKILNICQLAERGPVVLAFLATRGGDCVNELDKLEAARKSFPGVQIAAVAIRGDRKAVVKLVRQHGWGFPVGYDRDGIVANLYGVAVCPQTTFATIGGIVSDTAIGKQPEAELRRRMRAIVTESEKRGWRRAPAKSPS